jgi:hypothetical protein
VYPQKFQLLLPAVKDARKEGKDDANNRGWLEAQLHEQGGAYLGRQVGIQSRYSINVLKHATSQQVSHPGKNPRPSVTHIPTHRNTSSSS